jgi:nucleotide-binding universal stress UspA family protein
MKTILVPTDFSEPAANALQYAAALASQVRGKLILVHVIHKSGSLVNSGAVLPAGGPVDEEYPEKLNQISKTLQLENGLQIEVEAICRYGNLVATLKELVAAKSVDLVVMGTKGANNFLEKLVGTNTAGFMKKAACPVLAIPTQARFSGIKTIAYASDFESEAKTFLQQLFRFAALFKAQVAIVNIISEDQLNIFSNHRVMREIIREFAGQNYSLAQILENDVVTGLQDFVRESQAQVLAVAIHERGFLEGLFHKSVSRQLVYHPTLPLLALPEKSSKAPLSTGQHTQTKIRAGK